MKTCEFVSPQHPDKICDYLADSILDEYMHLDPHSRVAIEILGGHGQINLCGEVSSKAKIDLAKLTKSIVGKNFNVKQNIVKQSSFIAQGVDGGGAGDQGIMIGYACNETKELMPKEYVVARDLCQKVFKQYPFDGKVQVTLNNKQVTEVVVSFQNSKTKNLTRLVKKLITAKNYHINPAGEWSEGGFTADTGLVGRKIVVDAYGPNVPVGGGCFSGKDWTKVDRSGAYMARFIAVKYLKKFKAKSVLVKLAYAIGVSQPVMAVAIINNTKTIPIKDFDLSPLAIKQQLGLEKVEFKQTSQWGHFGRGFSWDGED
jgi:S-adenosylmethionine synthetase